MEIEKSVYSKFYWIFQNIYIETIFPGRLWEKTSRSKTSEKHWETPDPETGEILARDLSGKEARYFYRFMTDYTTHKKSVRDMPDDVIVKVLKWLGACLSQKYINSIRLSESDLGPILFQFFWEHYDPAFLIQRPELVVFKPLGQPNLLKSIKFEESRNTPNKKLFPSAIKSFQIQSYTDDFITDINLQDIEDLDANKKLSTIINTYFAHLIRKDYRQAFECWHSNARKSRWHNSVEEFKRNFYFISDLQLQNIHFGGDTSYKNVSITYLQQSHIYTSPEVSEIVKFNAGNCDFKKIESALNKLRRKGAEQSFNLFRFSFFEFANLRAIEIMHIEDPIYGGRLKQVLPYPQNVSLQKQGEVSFEEDEDGHIKFVRFQPIRPENMLFSMSADTYKAMYM